MVKKDNNFTLYLLKAMLLILIITIFFIISTKTILANPLPSGLSGNFSTRNPSSL
jgi:hypothetical protein